MSTPSSSPPAIPRAWIVSAMRQGGTLMARLIQEARFALSSVAAPDAGAGSVAREALRLLDAHEASMIKSFPMALLEACVREGPGSTLPTDDGDSDSDGFARMDDACVTRRMQPGQVQERITREVGTELARLDSLVSAAQGLTSVQPERNPLRPANYVRALHGVLRSTGVSGDVRGLWWDHMCRQLGPLLSGEYRRMAGRLREKGVEPMRRAVGNSGRYSTTKPEETPRHVMDGPQRLVMASSVQSVRGTYMTDTTESAADSLFTGEAPVTSGYSAYRVSGSQQLQDHLREPWRVQSAPEALGVQPLPEEFARSVLAQMMDTISRDERVMPGVRRAAQRLEPVLLQLVRHDAGFFFDELHPARRLLDVITERGMVYGAFDASRRAGFITLIDQIVAELVSQDIHDAQPFERALHMLDHGWDSSWGGQIRRGDPVPSVSSSWDRHGDADPVGSASLPDSLARPGGGASVVPEPALEAEVANQITVGQSTLQPDELLLQSTTADRLETDTVLLPLGSWVEIRANHGTTRLQLTWCSPHQKLFLFTGTDGSTRSMTRRMLDKLLAGGTLQRVSP